MLQIMLCLPPGHFRAFLRSDPVPGMATATHSGRSTERAEHGDAQGARGFVCWEREDEFNRPWPEPESLSAFREGHWGFCNFFFAICY